MTYGERLHALHCARQQRTRLQHVDFEHPAQMPDSLLEEAQGDEPELSAMIAGPCMYLPRQRPDEL